MKRLAAADDILSVPSKHLSPDVLELYATGYASSAEVARLEQHLLICSTCRKQLGQTERFIGVIKRALALTKGVIELHETGEGVVSLRIYQAEGGWLSHLVGADVDFAVTLDSRERAVSDCRTAFAEMFPGHTCSSRCRAFASDVSLRALIRGRCSVPAKRQR